MKSRQGYKGYVIEARSCELKDNGFSAEFCAEEHEADGVMETEFYLPDTFRKQESAIEAAIQAGRQKIDMDLERGSVVVNGGDRSSKKWPSAREHIFPTAAFLPGAQTRPAASNLR